MNEAKRRFTQFHYFRTMENGEKIKRSWLIYSSLKDAIFCFCCELFRSDNIPLRQGCKKWEGLSKSLHEHESGRSHQDCMFKWISLRSGIANRTTIDNRELSLFLTERYFWRDVLKRLIDIIIFLSERNLAFRGSLKKLAQGQMATSWEPLNY